MLLVGSGGRRLSQGRAAPGSGRSFLFQEKVATWTFETKKYTYGSRYENRVRISNDAELSNASITIDQLTMDDNGTYECSVSLMSDQDVTSRSRVRLLVLGECLCVFLSEEGGQRRAVGIRALVPPLPLEPNALPVLSE